MKKYYYILTLFLISHQTYTTDQTSLSDIIKNHSKKHHTTIPSMSNKLEITFVENMDTLNPNFPAIGIKAQQPCNAWLQVVQTDSKHQPEYRHFNDSAPQKHPVYPFYSKGLNFYDAPSWGYTFFQKPLSFWKAHTYSVQVDEKNRTINCLAGLVWGYQLKWFSFKPTMITPTPLTKEHWKQDWESIYHKVFMDYKDITR